MGGTILFPGHQRQSEGVIGDTMDLQKLRMTILVALGLTGVMLFTVYQQEQLAKQQLATDHAVATESHQSHSEIPNAYVPAAPAATESVPTSVVETGERLWVDTGTLRIAIDTLGGDIVTAELVDYPVSQDTDAAPFALLSESEGRFYVAQSGLISPVGPETTDKRAQYILQKNHYSRADLEDSNWEVPLIWQSANGDIRVTKRFRFAPNAYTVAVDYQVDNLGDSSQPFSLYGQLKREPAEKAKAGFIGFPVYQGAALSTADKPFKKVSYDSLKKEGVKQSEQGGWAAMVEHYFVSAWVPDANVTHNYYGKADDEGRYRIGFVSPGVMIAPGEQATLGATLYLGPEKTDVLKTVAPGLELTVDYGILWPIAQLLFWMLKQCHEVLGNWGLAIIGVTMLIKLAFYRLSASSFRSMAKLRHLQPRIQQLREQFGEDKQRMSEEMMKLYRTEKANPLGGCLPMLIQIPVFIALYYVLLESVELRHAPFFAWIQDLSSKDPYYVLPLLMGASMFLQQRLNPAPPDPVQAKVLMFMPIMFTLLFMNFPAGLVLYWFVNNVLSMLQQWVITRSVEKSAPSAPVAASA